MADLLFTDSEIRSPLDVTVVGGMKLAKHPETDALVWGFAFDDEPLGTVWSPDWCWQKQPDEMPTRVLDHVENGGYFVAWNAFFDRHIWNDVMVPKYGWPELRLGQVLCAQAQAEANNLPGKLEKAAEALGTQFRKDPKGVKLINMLCRGLRSDWSRNFETPDKMGHFRAYCLKDVLAMRDVWQLTRPLTIEEWAEYHVSEQINDRGVAVDYEFAEAAMEYAVAEFADLNERMFKITGDPKLTVTNHVRKARWLHEQLWHDEDLQQVVRRPEREPGKPRYSADRQTRELVLEALNQPEHRRLFPVDQYDKIVKVLECIEAGNSAAVRKFTAITNQHYEGRIHGQYSFDGAGATGRFSSRGVQIHNLIRAPVDKDKADRAIDAIERILDGAHPDDLVAEFGFPISRLLARLIRPTFVAAPNKMLVWADWSQIEARVLPWLAATPGAQRKLTLFRSGSDVYKHAAAPIFGKPVDQISDGERQVGKVAELALGFGGAIGAFTAMGRGYGVIVPLQDARDIVHTWRQNNQWCVEFWQLLWDAAIAAYQQPHHWFAAGRIRYCFLPQLMKGTLVCQLPDKRVLVYPQFKRELVEVEKENGETYKTMRTTFVRGFGSGAARIELWYGTLAENVTQATAASFLRRALVELAPMEWVVLHTHDEIVCETEQHHVEPVKTALREVMTTLPEWADGLPLEVDVESGPYYTK